MTLTSGTKLGPYEVVAGLGHGGMGEVYRAVDTRLGRTVAIKVISDHWRERPDLRARFRIEAEAVASLNHPHIAQLFDIGQSSEVDYLVMELVDGETLADRLARGRLPLKEALDHARTLADALGHAHRRGITHRDVKPGNVLLTRSGGLKLLDFGLARIGEQHVGGVAALSTVAAAGGQPLTEAGAALGTWQYMAPEQIRGEPADKRSDVFALGAVIYEMLSGRRPFERGSQHYTIAAVLQDDPEPLRAAAPLVTPAVERVVLTCLARDPDERWQSADEVRRALDTALVPDASAADRRSIGRLPAAVAIAAVVIAAVLAAWAWSRPRAIERTSGRTTRSVIALPANTTFAVGSGNIAFAPDGTSIVYRPRGAQTELRRYRLADGVDAPISGTMGGTTPFLSPDGHWVGFFAGGFLKKVPVDGGTPTTLCPVQSAFGGNWGEDGYIVFSHVPESGLFRVPASGGTPELLTQPRPEDAGNDHRYPEILLSGRAILYSVATGPEDTARIVVEDLRSGQRHDLIQGAASARFVPPDHVAYVRDSELFASPFSLERLELTGPPRRLATGVAEGTDGSPEFAFSGSGDLVYVAGTVPKRRLMLVDFKGVASPFENPPQYMASPRVSPDGGTIAYYVGAAKNNVWLYDIDRGTATRRTSGRFHVPVWRPDGRLTAAEGGPGAHRIVLLSKDGSGTDEVLIERALTQFPESWSPDGRTLVYSVNQPKGEWNLWALDLADRQRRPVAPSPFNQMGARFSPDGRWLAYATNETGRYEIYVRAVAPNGGRWQISSNGALDAVWAPDGRQLYYRDQSDGLWVAEITDTPRFAASRPRLVFQAPDLTGGFDITHDGRGFVMMRVENAAPVTQLQLVLNPLSPTAAESGQAAAIRP